MIMDTHIWVWFAEENPRLDQDFIKPILEAQRQNLLYVTVMSLWEIALLHKKNRLALHSPLHTWIERATRGINVVPVTPEIAVESVQLPDYSHRDPADRFIIATARILGLKILTQDKHIVNYIEKGYV